MSSSLHSKYVMESRISINSVISVSHLNKKQILLIILLKVCDLRLTEQCLKVETQSSWTRWPLLSWSNRWNRLEQNSFCLNKVSSWYWEMSVPLDFFDRLSRMLERYLGVIWRSFYQNQQRTNDLPFSQIFKLCLSLHSGELPSSEVSIIIIHIGRRVDVLRCEAVSEGHVVLPLLPPEAPRRDGHFPWLKEINLRTKCYNWT